MKIVKNYYEANIKNLRDKDQSDFLQTVLFMNQGETEERENVVAVEIIKYKDEEPQSTEYDIKDLHVDFNSSKRNIIESLKKHGNFLRSEEIYS